MSKPATFLITAGTGKIGSECARILASHPARPRVRIATRDPESGSARVLQALAPERIEPVSFDTGDDDSMVAACRELDGVMVIAPFSPDMVAWHRRVIDAVKAASPTAYAVKVSVTGAREPDGEPTSIPTRHGASERVVKDSGLPCTFLRPTIFAQHFMMNPVLYTAGADRFYLPTGSTKVAFLDCRDIAAMACALLLASPGAREAHLGAAYELTGSTSVSGPEIAELLSWVRGRTVTHVDGEDAFVARAKELGAPDGTKAIYKEAAEGWFSKVEHEPFESVVGRLPRTFAHFALDHAAHFAPRA